MSKTIPALLGATLLIIGQAAVADETSIESPDIGAKRPSTSPGTSPGTNPGTTPGARPDNGPDAGRPSKPRPGDQVRPGRPGPRAGRSAANYKVHRNTRFGFRFLYPNRWQVRPSRGPTTRITVGDGRGASCNVVVVPKRIPSDSTGRPRDLARFLSRLTRSSLQAGYPPRFQARIIGFQNNRLGGQGAKRILVTMLLNQTIPFSAEQYVTYRHYGVVTLTCGSRSSEFNKAMLRRDFATVRRTFRF